MYLYGAQRWTAFNSDALSGKCPTLTALSDTSTAGLPALPGQEHVNQVLQTVLFLHLTTARGYHAHTRTFLTYFGTVDEGAVAATLKNPERAVQEAERKTKMQSAREEHAARDATLRKVGMGLAALGGGVLVGVTGGLAAPLVGAGVTTVLGWLGVGGTAAGLLASGLAGSSVVCGALFGGSRKSVEMVGRYTREVRDLAIEPVTPPRETLAVRLCVSGWLDSPEDVTAPWTVLGGDDTFALRWVSLFHISFRILGHSYPFTGGRGADEPIQCSNGADKDPGNAICQSANNQANSVRRPVRSIITHGMAENRPNHRCVLDCPRRVWGGHP